MNTVKDVIREELKEVTKNEDVIKRIAESLTSSANTLAPRYSLTVKGIDAANNTLFFSIEVPNGDTINGSYIEYRKAPFIVSEVFFESGVKFLYHHTDNFIISDFVNVGELVIGLTVDEASPPVKEDEVPPPDVDALKVSKVKKKRSKKAV